MCGLRWIEFLADVACIAIAQRGSLRGEYLRPIAFPTADRHMDHFFSQDCSFMEVNPPVLCFICALHSSIMGTKSSMQGMPRSDTELPETTTRAETGQPGKQHLRYPEEKRRGIQFAPTKNGGLADRMMTTCCASARVHPAACTFFYSTNVHSPMKWALLLVVVTSYFLFLAQRLRTYLPKKIHARQDKTRFDTLTTH